MDTEVSGVNAGDRVGLMVNNLGATTPLELHLAAKEGVRFVRQELKVGGLVLGEWWKLRRGLGLIIGIYVRVQFMMQQGVCA